MRASAIEFRLRMLIMTVIVVLGFWAPWIEPWGIGSRIPTLERLALELSRTGLVRFTVAAPLVIVLGALIAAKGAVLRVWGTAYLGYGTVHHVEMQGSAVVADGPYRFVRNPLYLGGWCMMTAMAFTMPPTGALFAMTLLTVFLLRLILGEEAFLSRQLGEPYIAYLRAVPRLIPHLPLRANLSSAGQKPHWLIAVFSELNPIGVFVALAFLSWTFDNTLMIKAILISFGLSLIVRAVMPGVLARLKPAE